MTLHVQHLSFERNYQTLFSDIGFELRAGELLQVCGDNGCGKSTLLRLLAGLLFTENGKILWQAQSIFADLKTYQTQLNYLGHQNGLKLYLTVAENIQWFASLQKTFAKDHDLFLSFKKNNLVMNLSAGQKRRLALTRLLINPSKLWILDEPTTALDQAGQDLFFTLLEKHLAVGGMTVLTSHHTLPEKFSAKKIFLTAEDHSLDPS